MVQDFERIKGLEIELTQHVKSWRLFPVFEVLQSLRGVGFTIALTAIADLVNLCALRNLGS